MKWWVWFLALFVLSAFGAMSVFYVHSYVAAKPHGIILFVANGLDLNLLQKARQQALARGSALEIDRLNRIASLEVKGFGQLVPDEAAASTALASGRRVQNGYFGETSFGQHLDTLLYAAQRSGRATGLVTTTELTMPTPAAFYGRGKGLPGEELQNAADLIDNAKINVILGGGSQYFYPANVTNEQGRLDGRNLPRDAEKLGYQVVRNAQELDQVPIWPLRWGQRRLLGLFAPRQFVFSTLRDELTAMPSLAVMTRQAIRGLQYNYGGYFLVVENGLVATAAKNNWTQPALDEVAELDAAVGTALEYAGPKALVLVTNNYNLGALESYRDEVQEVPTSSTPLPTTFEWLTGPGGVPLSSEEKAWLRGAYRAGVFSEVRGSLTNPAPAVHFSMQAEVTTGPAWMASLGAGSRRLTGFINNTDVYVLLKDFF